MLSWSMATLRNYSALDLPVRVSCAPAVVPSNPILPAGSHTEWLLMTSGTTGEPKLVVHDSPPYRRIKARSVADGAAVWGTFYDIRRYGGLQMYLRAVQGRRLDRSFQCRRTDRGSSGTPCPARRNPSLGYAFALAPCADGSGDPKHRAALRQALWRNRRSADPRPAARDISASGDRSRLCVD